MLTLTITSCKRLELLTKTLNSFLENCLDLDMISEIILVDDGSNVKELEKIISLLEKFNKPYIMVYKSELNKGHVESLNILWDYIKTDYIIHLEDDWLFTKKDNFILKSMQIMNEDNTIKQVLLRTNPDIMAVDQTTLLTNKGLEYIKYNYKGTGHLDRLGRVAWPSFNLNPSIINFKDVKTLGYFPKIYCFEYNYSLGFRRAGFNVAYYPENYCEHLGKDNSSYKLNNTDK